MKFNMLSLTVSAKKLSALTKSTFKLESFGFLSSIAQQRTLASKRDFLKSVSKNQTFQKVQNYCLSSSSPKDLGKIVELDVEFDEVRLDDKVCKHEKKRRNKQKSSNLKVNVNAKSTKEIHENIEEEVSKILPEEEVNKILPEGNELPTPSEKACSKLKNNFSVNSNLLSSTMTRLKSRKIREKNKEIILEGKRLIHSAILAGLKPLKIFLSRRSDLKKLNLPDHVDIFIVPYKNLQLWSDVTTSQGIIGIFKMPDLKTSNDNSDSLPLTVICDNIRDPGNLGSVLRVLTAVNCSKLILTKGCVDVWEPKVLRAGAGAHFCTPIINNLLWSDIENEISWESKIVLADLNYYVTQDEGKPGNEISYLKTRSEIYKSLPVQCYHSIEYTGFENTVLVIGGETEGLSDDAYKFAVKRKGTRAFIPLSNGIESLNNSVALGIFAYEFKRQFDCAFDEKYNLTVPESKT